MKRIGSWQSFLPAIFVLIAAGSRWPGVFPPNFSAFYALAFCAGAFFPGKVAWWVPLGTLLITDLILDCYYYFALGINAFQWYQLVNYGGFAALIALGRGFGSHRRWFTLLSGGVLGACLFYVLTNTAAWLFNPFRNPEYTRDLAGWLIALTQGTAGHPPTWEFFRNTLLGGGLFTGLFVATWKLSATRQTEPDVENEEAPVKDQEADDQPATPPGREPEQAPV